MVMIRGDMVKALSFAFMFVLAGFFVSVSFVSALEPFGASFQVGRNQKAPADAPSAHNALAGNVTELTITGFSTTRAWQGYFGNVSGTIQLADANDKVLYNWSLIRPSGEVFATVSSSVNWAKIQCFNLTATGLDISPCNSTSFGGGTCPSGMNAQDLETRYNIGPSDVDGVNETFSLRGTHELGGGYNHSLFYVNNLQFSSGECPSTHSFSSTGIVNGNFQQVLLYDPERNNPVFAALIKKESVGGFNGEDNDFQMIVLEDGHGTDTETTTYYFYVELE